MSPMAVALTGCKVSVKELAKKATGEMRSRPSRRRGWLRDHMASANEAGFNRRETGPLPHNNLLIRGSGPWMMWGSERTWMYRAFSTGCPVCYGLKQATQFTWLPFGILRRAGLVSSEPLPPWSRRVCLCERGRLLSGGEQPANERQ
jgi:hypothetical protein